MQRRSFLALAGSGLVCGCGAVHQLPAVGSGDIAMAQAEVRMAPPPQRRRVSDDEVVQTLRTSIQLVRGPAMNLCHEMNVGVCDWRFQMSRNRDLNAGAIGYGQVVLNRGIVEYANNEEEVCLVVAHEIGHHAANHVARGAANRMIGVFLGVAVVAAAGAIAGSNPSAATTRSAAQLGATLGSLSYSKEQEREADYIAALILYRSGIDLDKARGFLVTMARASGRKETGMLDSHPAGPERVAGWDQAVAEIRATNGRLPQRA